MARKGYNGLAIELKRDTKAKVSTDQRSWLTELNFQGYKAEICYGFDDAQKVITDYLKD